MIQPDIRGLKPKGQLILVAAGFEPMSVIDDMLLGERIIVGTNTGSPIDIEATLFQPAQNVRATVEKVPFEQAPKAYEKMPANEARFRVVIEVKTAAG